MAMCHWEADQEDLLVVYDRVPVDADDKWVTSPRSERLPARRDGASGARRGLVV
jgi:hypothetical protein